MALYLQHLTVAQLTTRDEARYWQKNSDFFIPHLHSTPLLGRPHWNITIMLLGKKTTLCPEKSAPPQVKYRLYSNTHNTEQK